METGCRLNHTKDTCPLVGPLPAPPLALHEVQVPGGRRGLELCRVLGGGGTLQGVEPPQLKFHHYEVPSWQSSRGAFSPRGSSDVGPLASSLLGPSSLLKVSGWGPDLLTHTAPGGEVRVSG